MAKPLTTTGNILWSFDLGNSLYVDVNGKFIFKKPDHPLLIEAREALSAGASYEFVRSNLVQKFEYYTQFEMDKEMREVMEVVEILDKEHK